MRITSTMMQKGYMRNLNRAANTYNKSMVTATNYRKFQTVSEDPGAATKAFQLRRELAKKEASELQLRIEALIDVPVYTISEPPFWKVRIGNFETRDSANEYKNTFLQLFPELTGSTYVVPDKIIIIR